MSIRPWPNMSSHAMQSFSTSSYYTDCKNVQVGYSHGHTTPSVPTPQPEKLKKTNRSVLSVKRLCWAWAERSQLCSSRLFFLQCTWLQGVQSHAEMHGCAPAPQSCHFRPYSGSSLMNLFKEIYGDKAFKPKNGMGAWPETAVPSVRLKILQHGQDSRPIPLGEHLHAIIFTCQRAHQSLLLFIVQSCIVSHVSCKWYSR